MEKGQSEVTNKIRSAIKKKLAEISDFVDDELPEYIMILVANQRSKSQIEKDLSLFLRNDTVNFTNWLWDLLNNLKVCAKNNQLSVPQNESIIKKDIDADEDAVILEFDPDEHGTDFLCQEDTNDSILSKSSVRPSLVQANETIQPPVTKPTLNYKLYEKEKTESKSSVKVRKSVSIHSSKEPLSSAVVPVKRKISDMEDEYDPTKPEYRKAPSYNSNSRKYGGAAALQANKLLLRAVDDATKSILDRNNLEEFYKPTPIKVLTSKRFCNPSLCRSDNLPSKKISEHKVIPEPELIPDVPDTSESIVNEYSSDVLMEEIDTSDQVPHNRSRTICLKRVSPISDTPELEMESIEYIEQNDYPYSFAAFEEVRPKPPHFIVTLDGVNRTSFKKKFEDDSVDSMEDDDTDNEDEPLADETVSIPEKKLKLNERCKYWPTCKNSDQCSYHHPTVTCKCFPDCKFGDKCLYIHPNCKFDALCSRKDCPFTHVSKRKLPFIAVPMKIPPVKSRRMKVVCKFYPKCTSKNCPFIHPKLCRYGTDCRFPACLYGHFPVPSRSQMKWHATLS